ncbi:MAG: hypothetical protein ACI9ON_001472 [Limisphaerales bacterium]|jgi:hypothetical protein
MSTKIGQESRESVHELVEALRRDRQRLRVQLNLGRKEMDDEWHQIEQKWTEVEHHLKEITDESIKHTHHLGNEIADAYRRMKEYLGMGEHDSDETDAKAD